MWLECGLRKGYRLPWGFESKLLEYVSVDFILEPLNGVHVDMITG